ncbi:hypothetical protein [Oryza sativa Japonica Group]|uniref:Uncharacterized protein n=1 Tax=Oryza sativa subsp. japonica TaxID=39947 RepID=Q9AWT1_ORYSJ|nr:hypothetical protein [Oryza sativa Japonica Group]
MNELLGIGSATATTAALPSPYPHPLIRSKCRIMMIARPKPKSHGLHGCNATTTKSPPCSGGHPHISICFCDVRGVVCASGAPHVRSFVPPPANLQPSNAETDVAYFPPRPRAHGHGHGDEASTHHVRTCARCH